MTASELFLVFLLAIIAAVTIIQYRKYNVQRALKLPKHPPRYNDNAIKEAKAIGIFLHERAKACGVYILDAPEKTGIYYRDVWDILHGEERGTVTFIRLCHHLGCEVIVRQQGTEDTEGNENPPEAMAEYLSKLDEKYQ